MVLAPFTAHTLAASAGAAGNVVMALEPAASIWFQPFAPLSTFNGKNLAGTWELIIKNDASTALASTLNSWSLAVQSPATTI